MTYHTGPSIAPEVGGFYNLRAGLQCFISERRVFLDSYLFKGILLPDMGATGSILWYANGQYSTAPGYKHELDIVASIDAPAN